MTIHGKKKHPISLEEMRKLFPGYPTSCRFTFRESMGSTILVGVDGRPEEEWWVDFSSVSEGERPKKAQGLFYAI